MDADGANYYQITYNDESDFARAWALMPSRQTGVASGDLEYMEWLASITAEVNRVTSELDLTSDNWDDSVTERSFDATESALLALLSQIRDIVSLIEEADPPGEGQETGYHQLQAAIRQVSESATEVLAGFWTGDTERRRAAIRQLAVAVEAFNSTSTQVTRYLNVNDEYLDPVVPPDPGDAVNCADFPDHQTAQEWFNTYWPYYGDVALIDTNNNGVACESLLTESERATTTTRAP